MNIKNHEDTDDCVEKLFFKGADHKVRHAIFGQF